MLANLHLRLARIEATYGSLSNANHHLIVGRRLLERQPDLRLSGLAAGHGCILGLMECDFEKAIAEAHEVIRLSELSGHAQSARAAANNLGLAYLQKGNLDEAQKWVARALAGVARGSHSDLCARDTQASILMATGHVDECGHQLADLIETIRLDGNLRSWHGLSILHTWSTFLFQTNRSREARVALNEGLSLAVARGDRFWEPRLRLLEAELSMRTDRQEDAIDAIEAVRLTLDRSGLSLSGETERVRAGIYLAQGSPARAVRHCERALRIAEVLGDVRQKSAAARDLDAARRALDASGTPPDVGPPSADHALGFATMFDFADYPEIVGHEAFEAIRDADCAEGAVLAARPARGEPLIFARLGWDETAARLAVAQPDARLAIALGTRRGRDILLVVEPRSDLASRSFVSALRRVIASALALDAYRRDERERASLWPPEDDQDTAGEVFRSAEMVDILATARRIAPTDLPVLLTGETGTGKEVLARAIHRASPRAARPFLAFNCSAVPKDMLESQLFGHRRGAFTGAHESFPGVIRSAAGGTLFLDEIGELGPDTQPKLLRFLETHEVHALGEPQPSQVDVRIVAATNADLDQLLTEGRFREDLLYRLNVIRFRLPPLRERREEIPPLVAHFLARSSAELGKGHVRVSDETMEYLLLFAWPGNVRQLANEIRRAVALVDADAVIAPAHLSAEIRASRRTVPAGAAARADELVVPLDGSLTTVLEAVERTLVARALDRTEGHFEEAARLLGISRKGLFLKRKRWGLQPPAPPGAASTS